VARTKDRGYNEDHKQRREQWRPAVEAGRVACWRCGNLIAAWAKWDLGHDDWDRTITRGPEHRYCNRSAAARKGNRLRNRRRPTFWRLPDTSRDW
jgi:hypothetical protein